MTLFAFEGWRGRYYRSHSTQTLSAAEVAEWTTLCEALPREAAAVAGAAGEAAADPAYRTAEVGWLYPYPHTRGLFARVRELALHANAEAFGFDLAGCAEALQYTVYRAPSVGYDWHMDMLDTPD